MKSDQKLKEYVKVYISLSKEKEREWESNQLFIFTIVMSTGAILLADVSRVRTLIIEF